MEFEIEKGIPLTKPRSRYPFREMEVGDSVFIPGVNVVNFSVPPRQFAKRTRVENGVKGVRVWRILDEGGK